MPQIFVCLRMIVPVDLQSLHFTSLRHIAKLHIFALGLWTIASLSLTEKVLLANCLHLLRAFVTYILWRERFCLAADFAHSAIAQCFMSSAKPSTIVPIPSYSMILQF